MVSASTVSTTSSDPETLARKYMSSPQKLQRTGQHLSEGDAGRDWRQEEKGTTEDEMAGWHHRLDGHEFE